MMKKCALRLCGVSRSTIYYMQKRLYDFVASDMDSTLLSPEHICSEYTKQTLCALTQKLNVPVILATGRAYIDVSVVNRNLQEYYRRHNKTLSSTPSYMVTGNGSEVHDAANGTVISAHYIEPSLVKELYTLLPATETRINSNFFQVDHWYCRYDWNEMLEFHKESGLRYTLLDTTHLLQINNVSDTDVCSSNNNSNKNTSEDNSTKQKKEEYSHTNVSSSTQQSPCHDNKHDDNLCKGTYQNSCNSSTCINSDKNNIITDLEGVSEFFYTSWDKPLLTKLEALLHAKYDDVLTICFSSSYAINVTAKSVDKASGLRRMFHAMPAQPFELEQNSQWQYFPDKLSDTERETLVDERMRRTIAFGDDLNDARMLTSVGKGCIVGNANPALIERHPELEVIKTNVEHGPAVKLREIFQLELEKHQVYNNNR